MFIIVLVTFVSVVCGQLNNVSLSPAGRDDTIDNSGNVLFISRQVRERVIKSSLCVEPRLIVGNVLQVATGYCVKRCNL